MSKPLDRYDLVDRLTDSKLCWALAIQQIRLWGLIRGEYEPVAGERDWRWS
jgi:hypothetical protein